MVRWSPAKCGIELLQGNPLTFFRKDVIGTTFRRHIESLIEFLKGKMKSLFIICLVFLSVIFYACNQPAPTQTAFSGKITLDGYGETIDSLYYKVWSDSSWEEFNGYIDTNGLMYTTVLASDSSQYFYDSSGKYSGFELPQIYGKNVVIFDSSLASLPDTMIGNLTYQQHTTFSFQGTSYYLIDNETVVDSGTVVTSFGTFPNCPEIHSNQLIAVGNNVVASSDVVLWLAKGPSDVEQDFYDYYGYLAYSITMAYGVVNGQSWGVGLSKGRLGNIDNSIDKAAKQRNPVVTAKKTAPDMRSLSPMILKGIRKGPSKLVKR